MKSRTSLVLFFAIALSPLLLWLFVVLYSDGKEIYLGQLNAPITQNIGFKIIISNDFEQFQSISAELTDNNKALTGRQHLTGTDLPERNLKQFQVEEYDSIVFLTYFDSNRVIAAYDLRDQIAWPFGRGDYLEEARNGDTLLARLRRFDDKLRRED